MTNTKTNDKTNVPTAETRRMAAVSRNVPRGPGPNGKFLPLRYRAAEREVAEFDLAGTGRARTSDDGLAALQRELDKRGIKCERINGTLAAGHGGHIVTYNGWRFQVEGGPTFFLPEDAAEAIASFEADFE